MPYVHYGRIGDVWKHLPLCSILSIEKPRRYVETNSAGAVYALGETPEQKYGVYHFFEHAGESPILGQSPYFRLLREFNSQPVIPLAAGAEIQPELDERTVRPAFSSLLRAYLGSPGLAMKLLKDISEEFIFFDLEPAALGNIRDFAGGIGLLHRIKILQEDSIAGTSRLLDDLGKDDFIHFDPYSIFEPNAAGLSYWDVFLESIRRGIKAMLWYAFFTEKERRVLGQRFQKIAAALGSSGNNGRLHAAEVFLGSIQDDTVIVNPGVVGCGVLTSHLSSESHKTVEALAQGLVEIYRNSVVCGPHSGALRSEIAVRP